MTHSAGSKDAVAALVGATATGKTDAALVVAEVIGAEIVSCDSMQAYRGMDIGTAKASRAQRERVPHHMIDVFDPSDDVTVARYQTMSRAAIRQITRRGRIPLLVGGSGLYFRAVVDALDFPPRSPAVRRRLETEVRRRGPVAMHGRLTALDPHAAARIDARNVRRTVRALEVIEVTGRPFSEGYAWSYASRYELDVVGLTRARADLFARIEARVDRMLEAGLIDEARELDRRGLSNTARQAVGYRQVLEAPESATTDDIRVAIVRATKKLARRQEAWFRADPRVAWFDAGEPHATARLAAHLEGAVGARGAVREAGGASGVSLET